MRSLSASLCIALAGTPVLAPGPALAAELQPLAYTILSDDQPVGRRDVGIRYLPQERGEVRILESWTSLELVAGGARLSFEQRLGARFGGDRGFASSTRANGVLREVQARLGVDGAWCVTVTSGGEANTWILAGDAVDLTSAELNDRERALPLLARIDTLRLLSAETGQVLDGPVTALEPDTIEIGGRPVPVQRFRWTPPEGAMVLAFDDEGTLLAYDWEALGRRVGARAGSLPPPRSWGGGPEASVVREAVEEEGL
ncbi:MAG: hypothetical protein JXB39_15325 [Deltaproteobacteria bacterium]|nr:hypothetical protein [Deltaproteobacteria bacterium]